MHRGRAGRRWLSRAACAAGLASRTKAQPSRPSQPPPAQLAPPPSSNPAAPPRLPDTPAASSRFRATGSSSSAPQQPSSAPGTERAWSAGQKSPAWSESTATQLPQAASSGRVRAPQSSASSAKMPAPESSARSAGQEHFGSSASAAAGGSTWQTDWGTTAFQAAQTAQAAEEPLAPQQPSQAASLDPFAASLTLTPAAVMAGLASNNLGEFGGTG